MPPKWPRSGSTFTGHAVEADPALEPDADRRDLVLGGGAVGAGRACRAARPTRRRGPAAARRGGLTRARAPITQSSSAATKARTSGPAGGRGRASRRATRCPRAVVGCIDRPAPSCGRGTGRRGGRRRGPRFRPCRAGDAPRARPARPPHPPMMRATRALHGPPRRPRRARGPSRHPPPHGRRARDGAEADGVGAPGAGRFAGRVLRHRRSVSGGGRHHTAFRRRRGNAADAACQPGFGLLVGQLSPTTGSTRSDDGRGHGGIGRRASLRC